MEKYLDSHLENIDTSVVSCVDMSGGHVGLQTFAVHAFDENNHTVGAFTMQVAYPKNQDVIDIACYYQDGNDYYIATNVSIRPVLAARKHWVQNEIQNKQYSGVFREGIGVIYDIEQGDISIVDAVIRALKQKIGVIVEKNTIEVGNPYFPSVGASGETCIPCYVRIDKPHDNQPYYIYGERFEGERKVEYMSVQSIITGFFAGEIEDMRLVFLAYNIAYKHNIIIEHPSLVGDYFNSISQQSHPTSLLPCVEGLVQITSHLAQPKPITTINLDPVEYRGSDFLQKYTISATNKYISGKVETYEAQCVIRKGIDTIDMAGYFWQEGKLYLVAKESLRPSIQARNFLPHYINATGDIWHIEGIYASIMHTLPFTEKDIADIAVDSFYKKVGISTYTSTYVGSYFPSIGNNAEKVHVVMQQIDPSCINEIAEERDTYKPTLSAIEVDTIIQAYHQGMIKDPRIVLMAYMIKGCVNYENSDISIVTEDDKQDFQKAIHQPLQVDMFMKTVAQQKGDVIYDLHVTGKKYSIWYRRLVSYIEQELGGFLGERNRLLSETDKHFFSAMIPMFAVPSEELAEKYINYITHDQGHYLQGDIIPYYPETNTRMDKEIYISFMSWTEANAVFDSDYLYPMQMGLERFEALIGGESVATSFHKLGMFDDDEIRAAIVSIERDGFIPDAILLHASYDQVRNNIVDRLLRFHVMDKIQASQQYDIWKKHPYIARVALKFCNTTNNLDIFTQRMGTYHTTIHEYDEGVNTLKAYISRIKVKNISLVALHIASTIQYILDNNHDDAQTDIEFCEAILDELYYRQQQVTSTGNRITSMVANDSTVRAIKYANRIRKKVLTLSEKYYTFIRDTHLLHDDQKQHLVGSRVPYFTGFAQMPDNLHDLVIAKERENLSRVGH